MSYFPIATKIKVRLEVIHIKSYVVFNEADYKDFLPEPFKNNNE